MLGEKSPTFYWERGHPARTALSVHQTIDLIPFTAALEQTLPAQKHVGDPNIAYKNNK